MNRLISVCSVAVLVLLLSSCINDTPYSSNYAHIGVAAKGPGHVVFETKRLGVSSCREGTGDEFCGYTVYLQDDEVLTITAVPDEGREFTGWTRWRASGWNYELEQNHNPLFLLADGDYFFDASFQ